MNLIIETLIVSSAFVWVMFMHERSVVTCATIEAENHIACIQAMKFPIEEATTIPFKPTL